jgi:hypothetical protein
MASVPSNLKNLFVKMLSDNYDERPKVNDILTC